MSAVSKGSNKNDAAESSSGEVTESQKKMRGPITEYLLAKEYLNKHKIPQMFDSLMAALMIEKPDDHFTYLDNTIEKVKEIGVENVNWETFVYDLHPLRDPNRLHYVHDDFYDKHTEALSLLSSTQNTDTSNATSNDTSNTATDTEYHPQVFELTEAVETEDEQ